MWNKILAVNSFTFWPVSFIFVIYALGRAIITLHWKMLVIAIIFFIITTIAEVVLGILSE